MAIEFYTYNSEVWYRGDDENTERLTEKKREVVEMMIDRISTFYPEAYKALEKEYSRCKPNMDYFRFRIVQRFCKCNFGVIDDTPDLDSQGGFHLEHVSCPIRGECKLEGIVCKPKFDHKISDAEMRVLQLLYKGLSREDIAEQLYLSFHTVNNHIRNAYTRLGIHSTQEFMRWAASNSIFNVQ